jgi:hypothetical protein
VDTTTGLADADLGTQVAELDRLLRASPIVGPVLAADPPIDVPIDLPGWYVGAGAVAQTVWNASHGYDPTHGIGDLDLVYFDPADTSAEAEDRVERALRDRFPDLGVKLDVTNEARVHQWYEDRFGVPLEPYTSAEAAIATWPATAACVGVRPGGPGGPNPSDGPDRHRPLTVCAPYGLRDLFALVVRPNRTLVTEAVYTAKAERWAATWPRLTVLGW